ncbi:hypothetical protein FACS1894109_13120 [Spirochaetia bacterium]|nr:hypothetical protein FACS1894109_13120 [Spirochaetia bacterium]
MEDPQKNGFHDFNEDLTDEYFKQLTGEEQLSDGSFKPIRKRVEALDCFCLADAAADIFLDQQLKILIDRRRKAGASEFELEKISSLDALDWYYAGYLKNVYQNKLVKEALAD